MIKEIQTELMWQLYNNEITEYEYANAIKHISDVESINNNMKDNKGDK